MAKPKSYIRGRTAKTCCALLDALREAGLMGASVGYDKGTLIVMVDSLERDAPKVPTEFRGLKTNVLQDPDPAPPLCHQKVGAGCAHSRWELRQFTDKGITPNLDCHEPEYIPPERDAGT